MVSTNNDGTTFQVKDDSTVTRKEKDDQKCCLCIPMPTGITILFVLEVLYFVYFIILCATLVVARMFATGELLVPKGTFECTHTWDKYGKEVDGKFVQTFANVEACRNS